MLKLLLDEVEGLYMQWAETIEDLEQTFVLVHDEYVRSGYIREAKPSNIFFNMHNLLPHASILLMKCQNTVVCTLSNVLDSVPFGLPMDSVYKQELDQLRNQGRLLCEFCALATAADFRWRNIFAYIFREMLWHAISHNVNDLCIMVNPKHEAFYRTILLFEDLGPERNYPRLGVPAVALRADLDTWLERIHEAYMEFEDDCNLHRFLYEGRAQYLRENGYAFEFEKGSGSAIDESMVHYFLSKESGPLQNLSVAEKEYVRTCYPGLNKIIH
jgi:hypothetical protein